MRFPLFSKVFVACGMIALVPDARADAWKPVWSTSFDSDQPGEFPRGWWVLGKSRGQASGVAITDGVTPMLPEPIGPRVNLAGTGNGLFLFNSVPGEIARASYPLPPGDVVRVDLAFASDPVLGRDAVAVGLVVSGERNIGDPANRAAGIELRGNAGRQPRTIRVDEGGEAAPARGSSDDFNLLQIVANASPAPVLYPDLAAKEERELPSMSYDVYLNGSRVADAIPLRGGAASSFDLGITSFSTGESVGFYFDDIGVFHLAAP